MRPLALLVLIAFLPLAACAPRESAPPPTLALDCKLGFEALSKAISGEPGMSMVQEPGEPYRFYRPADGGPSFVLTLPGAPGHPAAFKQEAIQVEGKKAMMTTGCPYGDRDGYAQVLAYLQGLSK